MNFELKLRSMISMFGLYVYVHVTKRSKYTKKITTVLQVDLIDK